MNFSETLKRLDNLYFSESGSKNFASTGAKLKEIIKDVANAFVVLAKAALQDKVHLESKVGDTTYICDYDNGKYTYTKRLPNGKVVAMDSPEDPASSK